MITGSVLKRTALRGILMSGALLAGSAAFAQDCEVKIGTVGGFTGGGASWGLAEKAGTEFEAAYVNDQGGLQVGDAKCKVTVIAVDSQSTAAGGAAASNYLASEDVHVTVGPIVSPELAGFKPVAKRNDQVGFATSFAVDAIGTDFPLAFQKVPDNTVWGPAIITAAKERLGFETVVVMGPNDQGGTDAGNALAKSYADLGVESSTEWYQRGTTNFAPLVTRLMTIDPDTIELGPMPPGEAAILVKQLLENGYEGFFGRLGSGAATILAGAGGESVHKGFYWAETAPTSDPGMAQLTADYDRLMKGQIPDNSVFYNAQIAAENILKAISIAGTDKDGQKIAEALRSMTPSSRYLGELGWRGNAQYGINQQIAVPAGMSIIIDGQQQPQLRIDVPAE